MSPLMRAANTGGCALAEFLLKDCGADPNVVNQARGCSVRQ